MAGMALVGGTGVPPTSGLQIRAQDGHTQSDPSLNLDAEIPVCSGFLAVSCFCGSLQALSSHCNPSLGGSWGLIH